MAEREDFLKAKSMNKYLLALIPFLVIIDCSGQALIVGDLQVTNRLYVGDSVYLTRNPYGQIECLDQSSETLLFAVDPSDPSFEIPGFCNIGSYLAVAGPAALNSTIVLHVTQAPAASTTFYDFDAVFVLCPAGAVRNMVINPGFDGRLLILKDIGQASCTNVVITDVTGRTIDGNSSYKITNDYGSVRLIFDNQRNKWWTL